MNKLAFFYSLFCDNDISNSIRYLIPFIKNVKLYNSEKMLNNNMFIVLHTDDFTFNIIKRIAKQEEVSLENIVVKIHKRNLYLRGMIWRFESFYTNEYDICINAEGDWPIEKYFGQLELIKNSNYNYILHDVRQFNINKNCFAAGNFIIKPSCLSDIEKHKIQLITNLIDNIEQIHYGIDEEFFVNLCKKFLSDKFGLIIIHDNMRIFQHVENFEEEKNYIKQVFQNQDIFCVGNIRYNSIHNKPQELKYLKENSYILEDNVIEFKNPLRVPKNEWCNTELTEIINIILNS